MEDTVIEMLIPIFPNLTRDVLETSVRHPSNHTGVIDPQTLLQRCLDDLLELRTYTEKTLPYRDPPLTIYSDDSEESENSSSKEVTPNVSSVSLPDNTSTSDHLRADDVTTGPTHGKNDDVVITGHTPPKECIIVSDKPSGKEVRANLQQKIVKEAKLKSKSSQNVSTTINDSKKGKTLKLLRENIASASKVNKNYACQETTNVLSNSSDDMYREIEFSSDSNSSSSISLSHGFSDEDDLPLLKSPTKNSPLRPSKFSSLEDKPTVTPDFANWRDQRPSTSAVNTDKFILQGQKDILVKSRSLPDFQPLNEKLQPSTSVNKGVTATVNVNNSTDMNVNITVNVSASQQSYESPASGPNSSKGKALLKSNSTSSPQLLMKEKQTIQEPVKSGSEPGPSVSGVNPPFPLDHGLSNHPPGFIPNVCTPSRPPMAMHSSTNHNIPHTNQVHGIMVSSNLRQYRHPANQRAPLSTLANTIPLQNRPTVPNNRPTLNAAVAVHNKPTLKTATTAQNKPTLNSAATVVPALTQNRPPGVLATLKHAATLPTVSSLAQNRTLGMPLNSTVLNRPQLNVATTVSTLLARNRAQSMPATSTVQNRPPILNASATGAPLLVQNRPLINPPVDIAQRHRNQVIADIPPVVIPDRVIPPVAEEVIVETDNHGMQKKPIAANNLAPIVVEHIVDKKQEDKKSMQKEIMAMFPDVDPLFIDQQYDRYQGLDWQIIINNICNTLLETPQYPRKQTASSTTATTTKAPTTDVDYYKDYSSSVSISYRNQCEMLLQSEFKWVSLKDIRNIMRNFNGHYAPMHKVLVDAMKTRDAEYLKETVHTSHHYSQARVQVTVNGLFGEKVYMFNLLKCGRPGRKPTCVSPELEKEREFIELKTVEEAKEQDHMLALSVNESEYEDSGQLIECGCCYGEVAFENMIQCYEGHLFCHDCIQRYAQESVFGQGKAALLCMTEGCDAAYPTSQLHIALPSNILSKYEDRVQEENLNLADLTDLVRCPGCDFAALMDPGDKVFKCHNSSCLKETCRYCKEDWKEHFGKRCEEIEQKDETKVRLQFEEKMTEAKIRTCYKCKAKFTKSDGCNKMTCRCGAKMCYICRKPITGYDHFCQHFRDPQKGSACDKCTSCSLWTNPDQDDERALEEVRKEAQETRKAMGYEDQKLIGAPDEPPNKKARILPPGDPRVHMV